MKMTELHPLQVYPFILRYVRLKHHNFRLTNDDRYLRIRKYSCKFPASGNVIFFFFFCNSLKENNSLNILV